MGMLDGKTAIVTGGGQGVGRGIALALAAEGAGVAVAARTESKVQAVAAEVAERGGSALALVCDVNELDQIQACVDRTVERFGTVDILVNNAQQVPHGHLLEVSDEACMAAWTSGALAAIRFMRLCHPHLRGGGVIINQGSGSSLKTDPRWRQGHTPASPASRRQRASSTGSPKQPKPTCSTARAAGADDTTIAALAELGLTAPDLVSSSADSTAGTPARSRNHKRDPDGRRPHRIPQRRHGREAG